jgi:hypothetical protein
MEPKTSIKQHDFISGEPKHKWVIHWSAEQFQQGELGVTVAPYGVGKTGILQRMISEMAEERRVVNLDYTSLYPEVTVPDGHVTRPGGIDPNMRLRDFIEMRRRDQREREERERHEENDRFINKLTLNSFY